MFYLKTIKQKIINKNRQSLEIKYACLYNLQERRNHSEYFKIFEPNKNEDIQEMQGGSDGTRL